MSGTVAVFGVEWQQRFRKTQQVFQHRDMSFKANGQIAEAPAAIHLTKKYCDNKLFILFLPGVKHILSLFYPVFPDENFGQKKEKKKKLSPIKTHQHDKKIFPLRIDFKYKCNSGCIGTQKSSQICLRAWSRAFYDATCKSSLKTKRKSKSNHNCHNYDFICHFMQLSSYKTS